MIRQWTTATMTEAAMNAVELSQCIFRSRRKASIIHNGRTGATTVAMGPKYFVHFQTIHPVGDLLVRQGIPC